MKSTVTTILARSISLVSKDIQNVVSVNKDSMVTMSFTITVERNTRDVTSVIEEMVDEILSITSTMNSLRSTLHQITSCAWTQNVRLIKLMSSNRKWISKPTSCQSIPMGSRKTQEETHDWLTCPDSINSEHRTSRREVVEEIETEIEKVEVLVEVETLTQNHYRCLLLNHSQEQSLHFSVN